MSSRIRNDIRLGRAARWGALLGGFLLLSGLAWARFVTSRAWVRGLDAAALGLGLLAWSLAGLAAARLLGRPRLLLAGIAALACPGLALALARLEPKPYGIPVAAVALRQVLAASSLVAALLGSSLWPAPVDRQAPAGNRPLAFLTLTSGLFGMASLLRLFLGTTAGLAALLAAAGLAWWAGQRLLGP